MQLTAEQQTIARQWIADGLKLSDFQKRLEAEFGLKLTYMEVRFLVDDLKILPKDPEPPKKEELPVATPAGQPAAPVSPLAATADAPVAGAVKVSVDAVTRPGTMVSGRVTFSDGQAGSWYVDQYGRPGLVPDTKGYRPAQADIQDFQVALEGELAKLGM